MSAITDVLIDGLMVSEEACGTSLVWAAGTYPCTGGSELRGKRLDIGGYVFHADCVLVVRRSLFAAGGGLPQEKHTVGFIAYPGATETRWRIDAVRSLHGAVLILECNNPQA